MKLSYRDFKTHCKKKRPNIYYTWAFHQMAYPLSYVMYRFNMSPNVISVFSISLNFIGAYLIMFELQFLWGIFFFFASYLADCCDGNVARVEYGYLKIRKVGTLSYRRGMALENLNTNVYSVLFFVALGYYFYVIEGELLYFYVAVAVTIVKLLSRYASIHFTLLRKDQTDERTQQEKRLFKPTLLNEVKFFFHRVLNTGRSYYVIFALAYILIPDVLPQFYLGYFVLLFVLNSLKLFLVHYRALP